MNTTQEDDKLEEFLDSEEFLRIASFRDPEEDVINEILEKVSKLHDGNVLLLTSKLHEICFNLMVKSFIKDINTTHTISRIIKFQRWLDVERGMIALTRAHPNEEKFKVETYIDLNNTEDKL